MSFGITIFYYAKRLECESPLSLLNDKAKEDFRTSKEMLQVCFLIEANFPFRYQRRAAWGLQTLRVVEYRYLKDSSPRSIPHKILVVLYLLDYATRPFFMQANRRADDPDFVLSHTVFPTAQQREPSAVPACP